MKDEITANAIKTAITVFFASFVAYFSNVVTPLIILLAVVICDYITGIVKAYTTHTLSSRIGFTGIIKKLSYFIVVAVGMVCDYLISSGLKQINTNIGDLSIVSIIVIIWLIINELLSILENLSEIGVPLPTFLKKLLERLLVVTEKQGNDLSNSKEESEKTVEEVEEDYVEELIAKNNKEDVFAKEDENEIAVPLEEGEYASEEQSVEDIDAIDEFKGEM